MTEAVKELLSKQGFEKELVEEIGSVARTRMVRKDSVVISPEVNTNEVPLVIKGLLKLMRPDENGGEMFLYHLEGGETCAMSITCCIEGKNRGYKVVAEQDSELLMIPMGHMDRWVQKFPSFRRFVFLSYQQRFDEILEALDSLAFMKLDERLKKYLLDLKQASGSFTINKTHQEIANELNTSRVVISRLLKKLEKEEFLEQHRNRIEIL